jgi:hypothetical protein
MRLETDWQLYEVKCPPVNQVGMWRVAVDVDMKGNQKGYVMNQSKDDRIQAFLDDMKTADYGKYQILQEARRIVFDAASDATERFIYGGIMFTCNGADFGGVFASKKHVSFEFTQGYLLQDPDKHLEGGGKFRRHIKLRIVADVGTKTAAGFVMQAVGIDA